MICLKNSDNSMLYTDESGELRKYNEDIIKTSDNILNHKMTKKLKVTCDRLRQFEDYILILKQKGIIDKVYMWCLYCDNPENEKDFVICFIQLFSNLNYIGSLFATYGIDTLNSNFVKDKYVFEFKFACQPGPYMDAIDLSGNTNKEIFSEFFIELNNYHHFKKEE